MEADERKWAEEAIALCNEATRSQVTILLVRLQDANDQSDIVVTNAASPDMLKALYVIGRDTEDDQ